MISQPFLFLIPADPTGVGILKNETRQLWLHLLFLEHLPTFQKTRQCTDLSKSSAPIRWLQTAKCFEGWTVGPFQVHKVTQVAFFAAWQSSCHYSNKKFSPYSLLFSLVTIEHNTFVQYLRNWVSRFANFFHII